MTPIATVSAADLVLRVATLEDAAFVADVETAATPDHPRDPVLTRHEWSTDDPSHVVERFVAERDGRPVGYATHRHPPWQEGRERFARLAGGLLPEARTPARLDALFAATEERAASDGAEKLTAWAWEFDRLHTAMLVGRGFGEERRERFWELDLAKNRERLEAMTAASRARMREQGVEIVTLDRVDDPQKYRKLWRMSEEAEQDIPGSTPYVPTPFEQFPKWFASPALREDRIWIARVGDDLVGISMLAYPPVRGVVSTDWTATARSVRGRGVARAVKCETVTQAMTLGVTRVRTDNDFRNAPILHLNESMGYERLPDGVMYLKALR